jgi:hypothetical protein
MSIVQTVDFSTFVNAFEVSQYRNNFTREGLRVLFDYLEQLSDDIGENVDFDVCAIVCDYNESTIEEIIRDYSIEIHEDEDRVGQVRDYLEYNSVVLGETSTGFIFAAF